MLPHIAKGNNNLIFGQFLHNNIKYKEMSTKKKKIKYKEDTIL